MDNSSRQAAVITFPGSNCDDDLIHTLEKSAGFKVTTLWHKDIPNLSQFDLVCLPGGFSYGDYLRCGSMASLSPIMAKVEAYAKVGGLVLGVCNGFQILCETKLLPGALVRNLNRGFLCQDVKLRVQSTEAPWTNQYKKDECITIPIAHGDGRYIIDETSFTKMKTQGQILMTYVENPNGSSYDVAGVCNEAKNVFGLMPHPERATDLRSKDGRKFWASVLHAIEEKRK